jgi:hypothetical protein
VDVLAKCRSASNLWASCQHPRRQCRCHTDIQIFGVKNYRMAQDLANVIGGISAAELLHMPVNEHVLLIDSKLQRCKQVRHYEDQIFRDAA